MITCTHNIRPVALLTVAALCVWGCSSEQTVAANAESALEERSVPEDSGYTIPGYWRDMVAPEDQGTRYDAPWWYLTDEDLMEAVEAAGGRATIGFKDPDERGGVDDAGQVLASPESVVAGKEFLRSLGVTFDFEFQRIPAITATISPDLVPAIRPNPHIDYIEPNLPGERAD